ncbi:MAG TPA: saccharopine dehydrogenase NADP-binding domain-containing protein [Dokdonella sp.]|nr:saccharopine dehydrogenase NADP-binding domain-containing protein [Dokdonella sp.]
MTAGLQRALVYGANGYSGALIAEEAARRGLAPVLGGRNRAAVEALAHRLGLHSRVFDLDDAAAIARGLDGIDLLLNCAGPFSRTAAPLLEACLERRVHYLDITGEIDVFAHCHRADARARERGIVVVPGVGFDVVPTDSVAALLKRALPDAVALVLAFEAGGGTSPGTAKTSVEGLARGGRARLGGALVDVPLAWKTRTFVRDGVERSATTIPWGDVYTAYVSTGIPDIEVYLAMPPRAIRALRRLRLLQPLLRFAPLRAWLEARAGARPGPDAARRAATQCWIWGEARNAAGRVERLQIVTPNGYALTVACALDIAAHVLAHPPTDGGYRTPSQLMGAGWVLGVPGVRVAASTFDPAAAG